MNAKKEHPWPSVAKAEPGPQCSAPPHPFRAAPWYDPNVMRSTPPTPARLSGGRISLVVLGGVLLPIVSVGINHGMRVVDLGVGGIALCLASVASVLANLLLLRRKRRKGSKEVLIEAPVSTPVLALLLVSSLLSIVWWGYLALLFLPILPISLIALVVLGLGLCGLCPFFVTAISVVQTVRAARILRQRTSAKVMVLALVATPLLALSIVGATALIGQHRRQALARDVAAVVREPAFSTKRMHAIAHLRGREALLLERIGREYHGDTRQAMAEAYERLTDQSAIEAMRRGGQRGRRRHYAIRPFFFTQDESPLGFNLLEPFGGLRHF